MFTNVPLCGANMAPRCTTGGDTLVPETPGGLSVTICQRGVSLRCKGRHLQKKKEKNVFFRALSKFPEPPIQAIWSLYLDVTKYVLAPITERSTNDDYYGSDEKLPKTYQYYDFWVQIYK